jgi:exodeoxyribonuclease X
MTAYVLDTETTGHDEKPECIELAYAKTEIPGITVQPENVFCQRYRPTKALLYGAMAVHHILPNDLKDSPPHTEARIPADCLYLIGHNVDYDWSVLGAPPQTRRICTLAMARALFPLLDGHTISALSYYFSQDKEGVRIELRNAHSAAADVMLTARILRDMLLYLTMKGKHFENFEQLWRFSEECRIPTVWAFGKNKGLHIAATDRGYLQWCLRQPDMDPYVKVACRRALGLE